eukprot:CAMPEP_0185442286 /NCGR_PEP_ID=MMETSP1365-20130426/44435_1 /TAXON_ID=38817 /ORGANISM="Gephyrocapsa oceanica, Strain RCC1303" /LENGTH=40 /DNA_ID= /DNA_START= /DNA_END= /DNA_ORIENTATION=
MPLSVAHRHDCYRAAVAMSLAEVRAELRADPSFASSMKKP